MGAADVSDVSGRARPGDLNVEAGMTDSRMAAVLEEDKEVAGFTGDLCQDVRLVLFPEDEDSDYGSHKKLGRVSPCRVLTGNVQFPDLFQTSNLLFYERFEAYKDYLLGDAKPSEVMEFISEYLEKALEPSGWKAVWRTDIFEVLIEVTDVTFSSLKAVVRPCEPFLCEFRVECITEQSIRDLLEVKEQKVPLQELYVVYDDSGEFDQTAMSIEHVRFFFQHIWRPWDDEEEDYFDYFTRCAEPRLRFHYDILEERIPSELISEYQAILTRCGQVFTQFNHLRNALSDSDNEIDNVSMMEGMKMDGEMENLKRKLKLIENPLLRYLFCCQKSPGRYSMQKKGPRPAGGKVIHIVSTSMTMETLTGLTRERLEPESCNQNQEIQFHKDLLEAVNGCYDGDLVLICPGHYYVYSHICIADSVRIEGYGMPDDIIIEKKGKGDKFVECCGPSVKISNVKLIQHSAVEGIVSVIGGKTELLNCVFQCDTTGITVKKSTELVMKYCDLYGAKGAGLEIYPGSNCSLTDNGIHHCKDGILIKDFIDEIHDLPKIILEHNVIHNNEGYAVVLVKPSAAMEKTKLNQKDKDLDTNVVEGKTDMIQLESVEKMQSEGDVDKTEETADDSGKLPPSEIEATSCTDLKAGDEECNVVPAEECNVVLAEECNVVPAEECNVVPAEECNVVPAEECNVVPAEECNVVPAEEPTDDRMASEEVDSNQTIATELTANSRRKSFIHKKRLSALGITKADDEQILSQEMFVSIVNNEFKWNGKGSFGTFLF